MDKGLIFQYYREDVLHIRIDDVFPYLGQESTHLNGEEIVGRFNPDTGAVENLEIILFMEWILKEGYIDMYLTPYPDGSEWDMWSEDDRRLTLRYDKPTDTLSVEIDGARPYSSQKCGRVGEDDVSVRYNPNTGKAESFDIPFFYKRMWSQEPLRVDLTPNALSDGASAAAHAVG